MGIATIYCRWSEMSYPFARVASVEMPWYTLLGRKVLGILLTSTLVLPLTTYCLLSSKRKDFIELFQLVFYAEPISELPYYKDETLLSEIWSQSPYKEVAEYQAVEGYCGSATLRNCVASFSSVPKDKVPLQVSGAMGPKAFCDKALQLGIKSEVIRGGVSYKVFVETLKKSNSDKTRVAVNFLRPALFGFKSKTFWFLPWNFILGLMGGHFSPVISYMEDIDHVAIFDLNAAYGFYLCPTRRLYESVHAMDLMGGQRRALITLQI